MLSLGCKASIKAVIFLATQPAGSPRPGIGEVARHIGENEHTVGKLLQRLVKAQVINSAKGPAGGFFVTQEQLLQPVMAIIHAIDGADVFRECGLGLSNCSHTQPCPLHEEYLKVRDAFSDMCSRNTIADLCVSVKSGAAFLIN